MRDVGKRKRPSLTNDKPTPRTLWTVIATIPAFIEAKGKERAWILASAFALSCITWAWYELDTSPEKEAKLREKQIQLMQVNNELPRAQEFFGVTAKAVLAYQQIDKHFHDTYSNGNLSQDERKARAREGLMLIAQTKLDFSQNIARVHGLPIAAGRLRGIKANVEEKLTNVQKTMFRIEDIYKLENSGAVSPEKALAAIDDHITQFSATFTDGSEFAQQLLSDLRAEVLRVTAEDEQLASDMRMLHVARYLTYLAFIYLFLYVGSLARAVWRFETKPSHTLSK